MLKRKGKGLNFEGWYKIMVLVAQRGSYLQSPISKDPKEDNFTG